MPARFPRFTTSGTCGPCGPSWVRASAASFGSNPGSSAGWAASVSSAATPACHTRALCTVTGSRGHAANCTCLTWLPWMPALPAPRLDFHAVQRDCHQRLRRRAERRTLREAPPAQCSCWGGHPPATDAASVDPSRLLSPHHVIPPFMEISTTPKKESDRGTLTPYAPPQQPPNSLFPQSPPTLHPVPLAAPSPSNPPPVTLCLPPGIRLWLAERSAAHPMCSAPTNVCLPAPGRQGVHPASMRWGEPLGPEVQKIQ